MNSLKRFLILGLVFILFHSCSIEKEEISQLQVSVLNDFLINEGSKLVVFINDLEGKSIYSKEIRNGDVIEIDLNRAKKYNFSYYIKSPDGKKRNVETFTNINISQPIVLRRVPFNFSHFDISERANIIINSKESLKSGILSLNTGFKESFRLFHNYILKDVQGPRIMRDSLVFISLMFPDNTWKYTLRRTDRINDSFFKIDEEDLMEMNSFFDLPYSEIKNVHYELEQAIKYENSFVRGYTISTNGYIEGVFGNLDNPQIGFPKEFDTYHLKLQMNITSKDAILYYDYYGKTPRSLEIPFELVPEKRMEIASDFDLSYIDNIKFVEINLSHEKWTIDDEHYYVNWTIYGDGTSIKINELPEIVLNETPELFDLLHQKKMILKTHRSPNSYEDYLAPFLYNKFDIPKLEGEYFVISKIMN